MSRRMLRKDIRLAFTHSWGRFVSIVCLMALGSFALVGLWVTGPDMEATGKAFYGEHNLADVTVVSEYGLNDDDRTVISGTPGVRQAEFGYFKDVVIKGTNRSVRINSLPEAVSTYEVIEGRLPQAADEIALDEGLEDSYGVGSTFTLTEEPDIAGDTVLTADEFEVVGFVRSSEAISGLNLGTSTAGSGQLNQYAVVTEAAFDSDVAMIARITFTDTQGLDYWSDEYADRVQEHKDELSTRLADQPDKRVEEIRESRREQIAKARQQVDEAKTQLADAEAQLDQAKAQIEAGKDQISTESSTAVLGAQATMDDIGGDLDVIDSSINALRDAQQRLEEVLSDNRSQQADSLESAQQQLQALNDAIGDLYNQIGSTADQIQDSQRSIRSKASDLADSATDGTSQLIEGQRTLEQAEEEYQTKLDEFNEAKPAAEEQIAEAERQIRLAEEKVEGLSVPAYSVNGRREGLGGEGYRVYMIIADIVAKLARIFPIFLYLVAALVTFATMGRMVDEERVNSGTLKALGYSDMDVMRKFTMYGFAASTVGTIIGAAAGHTLLPLIVDRAYSNGFRLPRISLEFHPGITLVAFLLAWASAVLPSWLVASRELREKPAALLLPKPPAKGSTILLERVTPLWNRMSFTRKVTARNLFRYKGRMVMTIFGVCGAVALLFAGLGVQGSIGEISERQFGDLIHYDLIVAENSDNNQEQSDEVQTALEDDAVRSSMPIHYETLTKTVRDSVDKQEMTLLVTDDPYNYGDYMTLRERGTERTQVLTDNGAVISERLSETLGVGVGDTFTVDDENGVERRITVTGVCEMYIGHFVVMSSGGYERAFHQEYQSNAHMVRLVDTSTDNAAEQGARFMELSGVRGVVQNITNKQMVDQIVISLNQIMEVLIVVAVLLGVVILYNLTNLNVSERIRELSTIKVLGFHTGETTMYIYRETLVLSALGVLAGFGFGAWLHRYIITEVPPDEVMFDPSLVPHAFWMPALVIALVLAALGWVVWRRLKKVDMLAALKSVD
ncbi:ABC transporter permease [Bifidobacterium eulemuris]|uniref:Cell division protein FtsX n=1 Tax=Bifidobacterium eulemuris TaxID=1765219 RepID=A0A261GCS3_9BIFI|nr:ABC transporter permease [Bifidobacterium eulemuris]OZG69217.1 cell division protein FtsX [Bifidobacterium eulemuris]QOL31274.1 FtsX-like permease family protein [Bifidobacterium eulemuris]